MGGKEEEPSVWKHAHGGVFLDHLVWLPQGLAALPLSWEIYLNIGFVWQWGCNLFCQANMCHVDMFVFFKLWLCIHAAMQSLTFQCAFI